MRAAIGVPGPIGRPPASDRLRPGSLVMSEPDLIDSHRQLYKEQ